MIKRILYFIIILLITGISYLSYFGLSTNKFNSRIENKIKESYPNINVELQNVKILLDILKLSINLETKSPIIFVGKEEIKLEEISTTYNIKSIFIKEFAISNLFFHTNRNKVKKIIKLIRANEDSPQLFILDKIVKDGDIKILAKFNFDDKGKLIQDDYEIISTISDLSLKLLNKAEVKNLSFNFNYTHNNIKLYKLSSDYSGLKLSSDSIVINKQNEKFLVKGNLKSLENTIPKEILSIILKDYNFENVVLSSDSDFSFNISKKFKISNLKINSKINLKEINFNFVNKNIKKFIPNFDNNFKFFNHLININYKDKIILDGSGEFQIGDQKDKIKYYVDFKDEKINYDLNFDLNEIPIKIDLINFSKKKDIKAKLKIQGKNYNKKIKINKISLSTNNSNIILDNFEISKNYRITNFEKVKLNYLDNQNNKNDLLITNFSKNNYLISGNNFNLSNIIDDILFSDNDDSLKLFDKKNRVFKIDFKKNNIDEKHYLLNLKGNFQIKNNEVYDMTLGSSFPNKKIVSLTIRSKNKKKITTFYSDLAKPFVKKYKFIKGFEQGKLDFYSVKENKISNSQLKIYDFRLKELPALTKLLSLASLQGIADIMTGEGIRFNEFEMKFNNDNKLMTIDEIYAIGSAISILMNGYVENNKLISLRGTLVPATTLNKVIGSLPLIGNILVGKKTGEGVFGVSFKIKGPPKKLKTTVNPIKTLTPRFITRTIEKVKKQN